MLPVIVLLFVIVGMTSTVCAAEAERPGKPLFLSTSELVRSFEAPKQPAFGNSGRAAFNVLDGFANRRVGLMPLFALVPPKHSEENGDSKPPRFALVARAKGRTMVSFTQTGMGIDRDDDVLIQRTVVSDLFQSPKFSVAVQEDHALDGDAMKFVGIGARFMARPEVKVLGWGLRLQLFTSFHPKRGGTAYFALTGSPDEQSLAPPTALRPGVLGLATQAPPAEDWPH
jgi:hypothetical protein